VHLAYALAGAIASPLQETASEIRRVTQPEAYCTGVNGPMGLFSESVRRPWINGRTPPV
jgi:hypothetical protein